MAYTEAQVSALDTAIIAVSNGAKEIVDAFGNRVTQHNLREMMALRKFMSANVAKSARTSGYDKHYFKGKT